MSKEQDFTAKRFYFSKKFIVGLSLILLANVAAAAEKNTKEFGLKAALIYQFSRFITWPEDSIAKEKGFQVCVMGDDPFGDKLDGIKQRKYKQLPIYVRYPKNREEAKHCQILYLVKPDCSICKSLKEPVLLVSSQSGFVEQGGEIEFVLDEGRIRFSINADSIRKKNLSASAKLFEVASSVVGNASN